MSKPNPAPIKLSFAPPKAAQKCRLKVDLGSDMAEGIVVDGNYRVAARGVGKFEEELPPGRYQLRVRVGREAEQHWIDLSGDETVTIDPGQTLSSTPAPIDPDLWPDPLLSRIQSEAWSASALIVIRDHEQRIPKDATVRLLDSRDRAKRARRLVLEDGKVVALILGSLKAGAYRLHVGSRTASPVEMALWVADGYQTQVYFERCRVQRLGTAERAPHFRTVAITLIQPGADLSSLRGNWRTSEMMRANLGQNRRVVPVDEIMAAVNQKVGCPMLGLLGAHHLYWLKQTSPEGAPTPGVGVDDLRMVLDNLERLLPGCPDLLALRCAALGEPIRNLRTPPMLYESWKLIAPNASVKTIPRGSLASRIGLALTAIRPWLVWKTDLLTDGEREPTFAEEKLLQTRKAQRKIGQLADRYSLPRSTVRSLLKK